MPALFRRSVIFADIKNVIVSIDAIVASRIGRFLKENPNYKAFLSDDIVKLSNEPVNKLKFIVMADKENKNFLKIMGIIVVVQICLTSIPGVVDFLDCEPISIVNWLIIFGLAILIIPFDMLRKVVMNSKNN